MALLAQAACSKMKDAPSGPGSISESHYKNEESAMSVMGIVTDLIAGGIGGNIAGALLKKINLGPIGNTIAGIVGGVGGGQLLSMLTGGGAAATAAAAAGAANGGTDMSSILTNVVGGGVGGAIVMAIVGAIKTQMAKSSAT
jgi:uncharacterized membrane protein YeaQ/YmgE (transglycosylase-associated protein family)